MATRMVIAATRSWQLEPHHATCICRQQAIFTLPERVWALGADRFGNLDPVGGGAWLIPFMSSNGRPPCWRGRTGA